MTYRDMVIASPKNFTAKLGVITKQRLKDIPWPHPEDKEPSRWKDIRGKTLEFIGSPFFSYNYKEIIWEISGAFPRQALCEHVIDFNFDEEIK